jgi:hypothetical protein
MSPSPMTEQQMTDLAYVIFAKQPILQPDLRWNRRPTIDRVWYLSIFVMLQSDLGALPLPAMFNATSGQYCFTVL